MTEEQLSALLRIKRFEQPPPQYFDRLLQDIHRRQRSELLRRPLWKIAAERLQTFFSEHSMGHLSYAGALAAVMVVGVAGIGLMTSGGTVVAPSPGYAKAGGSTLVAAAAPKLLNIENAKPQFDLDTPSLPTAQPGYMPVAHQPRYIIDARPVLYEPSSAYSF
ncbi:MAG: hypothetical protein ABJF10_03650 [Chthoniobacter sp.]|uniref:hypothetical protein n=1 Tax=Chthoniobacter sp. TaxID=2510640 RepID=UPI0032AD29E8